MFPSIIYINVPIDITRISTKRKKTNILLKLLLMDFNKRCPSLMKLNNLNTLKTLMSLKALIINTYLATGRMNPKYKGKVAIRSTIPKKLNMYERGFGEQYILRAYSSVKKNVRTYSKIERNVLNFPVTNGVLSMIMTRMLMMIAIMRVTSNAFPAFVSVSNIIL